MCGSFRRALSRCLLLFVAGSTAVLAQPGGDGIPQVIVSGSRFSEAYESGDPIGASIITAADIRASGATTVYEAMRRLGGLHTRSNLLGTGDDTIDLRGFGVTGDQNTLVLIDGQRVSANELQTARLSSVPLNSIERIEILRGSGAVLYGGGATGGVINVITRAGSPGEKSLQLGFLAGSYGTQDLRIDGAVAGRGLALDFAANHFSTDNHRRNNGSDQRNAAARLRFVGESGELALRVASERSHSRLPAALSAAQYANDPIQTTTPNDYADTDANHYAISGIYRFGWGDAALDVFRRDKVDRFFNEFGGSTNITRSGSSVDGVSPRVRVTLSVFGLANQFVVGHDASRWAYRNQQSFRFGALASEIDLGNANLSSDETGSQHNRAWYFKNDLKAGDLRFSLGARRETLTQSTSNPLFFLPPLFVSALTLTEFRRDLHAEEIGIAWSVNPRWTVHARFGNSFRLGNIDENRFRFPTPGFLEPQTSKDTEAGASYASRVFDADLRWFNHSLNNEILFVPGVVSPPFGANINLAPTEREGFEASVKWRPTASVRVSAFLTQVRARFRSGSFGGGDLTGKEVPLVPRERAGVTANWRMTTADSVSVGLQYVGSQIYDNDQLNAFSRRIPAYSTIDAKYTRTFGNLDLSVSGTNLGNRGYFSYGITGAGGASNVYPERRRALFVSVAARF